MSPSGSLYGELPEDLSVLLDKTNIRKENFPADDMDFFLSRVVAEPIKCCC